MDTAAAAGLLLQLPANTMVVVMVPLLSRMLPLRLLSLSLVADEASSVLSLLLGPSMR